MKDFRTCRKLRQQRLSNSGSCGTRWNPQELNQSRFQDSRTRIAFAASRRSWNVQSRVPRKVVGSNSTRRRHASMQSWRCQPSRKRSDRQKAAEIEREIEVLQTKISETAGIGHDLFGNWFVAST